MSQSADGIRYRAASKDDIEQRDEVHDRHKRCHPPYAIYISSHRCSDARQHETNAELDQDDSDAEKYFEQEEP